MHHIILRMVLVLYDLISISKVVYVSLTREGKEGSTALVEGKRRGNKLRTVQKCGSVLAGDGYCCEYFGRNIHNRWVYAVGARRSLNPEIVRDYYYCYANEEALLLVEQIFYCGAGQAVR